MLCSFTKFMLTGCDSGGTSSVTATPAAGGNGKFYINSMTGTVKFTNIEAYEGISKKKRHLTVQGFILMQGVTKMNQEKNMDFLNFPLMVNIKKFIQRNVLVIDHLLYMFI